MRYIPLESLLLGLDDLLTKRLAPLQSFANGAANEKLLETQRDKIAALPLALPGRPLADQLDAADARHDGLGGSIWFFLEACLRHPDTTEAMSDAAKKIRAAFVPTLDGLTATYEAEAKAAKDHKVALASLQNELKLFSVPGGTLYEWAANFVMAGEDLDALLSQRSDAKDRTAAAQLRSDAIGMLNRLRKSLALETKGNPKLPADLDAQVFSYFDLLEANAAEAHAEKKAKAAKKAAPPAAPEAPPAPGTPSGSA